MKNIFIKSGIILLFLIGCTADIETPTNKNLREKINKKVDDEIEIIEPIEVIDNEPILEEIEIKEENKDSILSKYRKLITPVAPSKKTMARIEKQMTELASFLNESIAYQHQKTTTSKNEIKGSYPYSNWLSQQFNIYVGGYPLAIKRKGAVYLWSPVFFKTSAYFYDIMIRHLFCSVTKISNIHNYIVSFDFEIRNKSYYGPTIIGNKRVHVYCRSILPRPWYQSKALLKQLGGDDFVYGVIRAAIKYAMTYRQEKMTIPINRTILDKWRDKK